LHNKFDKYFLFCKLQALEDAADIALSILWALKKKREGVRVVLISNNMPCQWHLRNKGETASYFEFKPRRGGIFAGKQAVLSLFLYRDMYLML
jgi:hypothetical protein